MCGILAVIDDGLNTEHIKQVSILIDERGPDYSSPILCHTTRCGFCLKLKSSVLHLRGDDLQRQPLVDKDDNVLLFNGMVYKYKGKLLQDCISDTSFLANRLAECRAKAEIADVIASIDGPFALVYWHNGLNAVFYSRDIFGRRSLCVLRDKRTLQVSAISSISPHLDESCNWEEVDCLSIHCIQYDEQLGSSQYSRFNWTIDDVYPRTSKCSQPRQLDAVVGYIKPPLTAKLNADLDIREIEGASSCLGMKLLKAVSLRYDQKRKDCLSCRRQSTARPIGCTHSKVAVAFSGGLDSTLIALALDKIMDKDETIDLVNVAFRDNSSDRKSASCAFRELMTVSKQRNWRFVICDVLLEDLQERRESVIKDLILPCNTVIDDSLGCACWFIGRAEGRSIESKMIVNQNFDMDGFIKYNPGYSKCHNEPISQPYRCQACLWFVGSAIDEQLGGYSSHRSAWREAGLTGIFNEISFQMRRLSSRNLGRDDRCYSHHGRDINLPFLDSDLVSYLNELPISTKMNLDEPLGTGPKKILRQLAIEWGLHVTSTRIKKAMQFGSKIANLEDNKEKGGEVCRRLKV